jgi:hypothetical protein
MGNIPKPLLVAVTALLTLCIIGGFALGLLPSLKRGSASDDEEAPIAAVSGAAPVKDATPLVEPPPPPPKPKVVAEAAASDAPASDTPPVAAKPIAPAAPPTEAAPGAPPVQPAPTPAAPKLPADLPPV